MLRKTSRAYTIQLLNIDNQWLIEISPCVEKYTTTYMNKLDSICNATHKWSVSHIFKNALENLPNGPIDHAIHIHLGISLERQLEFEVDL